MTTDMTPEIKQIIALCAIVAVSLVIQIGGYALMRLINRRRLDEHYEKNS